jgi:imidazolonepropionase-like amidohydrolase
MPSAAEAIGIDDRTGMLEPGKWADVILIQGDPASDICMLQQAERITCVIKVGQIVKGAPPGITVAAGR